MSALLLPSQIQLNAGCVTCDSILEYLKLHIQHAHSDKVSSDSLHIKHEIDEPCTPVTEIPEVIPFLEETAAANKENCDTPVITIDETSSPKEPLKRQPKHQCDVCDRSFMTRKSLRRHKRFTHDNVRLTKKTKNDKEKQ